MGEALTHGRCPPLVPNAPGGKGDLSTLPLTFQFAPICDTRYHPSTRLRSRSNVSCGNGLVR